MTATERPSDLLPYPFCGGDAEIDQFGDRRKSTIYSCTECGCRLETSETFAHGAIWNRRAHEIDARVLSGPIVWLRCLVRGCYRSDTEEAK